MADGVYSARTPKDLETLSKKHGIQVLAQLDDDELRSSASRWKFRHLIAYRLLIRPQKSFLKVLADDHAQQCPVCSGDELDTQKLDHECTKDLIGECPRDLFFQMESDLLKLPAGTFWVALARAARPERQTEKKHYPKRDRRQVLREGYVNSEEIPGSSPTAASSSEFEVDLNTVDEDEHDSRRNKPEEVTVYLVTCFFQVVLNRCLVQHLPSTRTAIEVRPRTERKKAEISILKDVDITPRTMEESVGWSSTTTGGLRITST